ncbi:MAG: ankyrin repeat domain-containing protein, partial [Fidelibacterota bacterium]
AGICEIEPKWEYAINTLDDGQLETLEILLENGADPNKKNDEGLTALDLANQNYHLNAANVLKKYNGLEGKYI